MQMGSVEQETHAQKTWMRFARLDRALAAIGEETASLTIIILALANLCAPVMLWVAAAWLLAVWVGHAAANPVLGWIAGLIVFAFFCRYVWGSRLRKGSRRAAEALVAKPDC